MKTYHADPSDHDAVAKALLEKLADETTLVDAQAAIERDASRWRKVRRLTTIQVRFMSPQEKAAWDRMVRGGWYTADMETLLDAMPEEVNA